MRIQAFLSLSSLVVLSSVAALGSIGCAPAAPDELENTEVETETDGNEPSEELAQGSDAVTGGTVEQAIANTCGTASVKGLSLQIIAEGNCISPGAFSKIPARSNVSYGSGAFPFLEKPAMNQFLATVDAHKTRQMVVNSMLRTVAQQYMLYRWGAANRCGINVVAKPGNSNHETGLAMDIGSSSTWRSSLQGHGFKWFGSSDAMHYDYAGSGAVDHRGLDVKAFQRLWNANHPTDKISVDGGWGPQTEARMKKAPAAGFASGPTCGSSAMLEVLEGVEITDGDEDHS
jgi:LAS superfamily LD-carboxypeptidase LdcB